MKKILYSLYGLLLFAITGCVQDEAITGGERDHGSFFDRRSGVQNRNNPCQRRRKRPLPAGLR